MAYPASNPSLSFVKSDWSGNPLDSKGLYCNIDNPSERSMLDVLQWKILHQNPHKDELKKHYSNVDVLQDNEMHHRDDGFVWLGHNTYLFYYGGKKLITDPVFFDLGPIRRWTPLPDTIDSLTGIDFILLSHNHRDHCDYKSMKAITDLNPNATILTGLRIGGLLKKWNIGNPIIEAGWYQELIKTDTLRVIYLPSKHWARRWLTDLNTMLWGSFLIEGEGKTLYWGGDSGLGDHFGDIATLFPNIDTAFLGIGAYAPEWFMSRSHTSPEDVVKVCKVMQPKTLVPMHYGTYDLSDEPLHYPKVKVSALFEGPHIPNVVLPAIGEKVGYEG